ncbi:MAG TPA: aldo/keto reductase [Candidatus Acidoferrales bacterium]|nr:aldo/keto reductase [Candidatus Acidoferrales bacterium]
MATTPPNTQSNSGPSMPYRKFGKHDEKISALGFGGHHLGDADDEKSAVELVQQAVDGGITFFDNCWEYRRGQTELWMGKGLKGRRDKVFLMTKVCTHGRDASLAMKMLDESLRRLQTDHLDLWQIHGVTFDNDPELFIRTGGAAEALRKAKEQGKVRYVGFTGHKDPAIHVKMLKTGFPFDAVQMPLNAFDGNFRSFEKEVLPEVNRLGMAALGMKPFSGHGEPIMKGLITADESLRYAMSLPVTTTITGMEKAYVLQQNLAIASNFKPMSAEEMQAVRDKVKQVSADGRYELYKVSLKFDNPEARIAHDFILDDQSAEVKDMMAEQKNTGHPFREKEKQ